MATKQNIARLWLVFKATGSPILRSHLIQRYAPLVRRIAEGIHVTLPQSVDVDDLISIGTIALMQAIERFDPARGWEFSTYARSIIHGRIMDQLRREDWLPRVTRQRAKAVAAAVAEVETATGRPPTREELRQKLNVTERAFRFIERDAPRPLVSLHEPLPSPNGTKDVRLLDTCTDERQPSADTGVEYATIISRVLRDHGVTDALILRLRYIDGETFDRIGEHLGICASAACGRHRSLLNALRARFAGAQRGTA